DFRMVRDGEDGATAPRTRRERAGDKALTAAEELAAVKDVDRAVRKATKAKPRGAPAASPHPARAAKSAARKSGGRLATKSPRRH
ncbi:MAG TPA: hypothetical protein VF308_16345, partial [Caldimonas sp.]